LTLDGQVTENPMNTWAPDQGSNAGLSYMIE